MPSTPSVKRMPHDGIQRQSNACCQPAFAGIERPPQPERDDELDGEDERRQRGAADRGAGRDLVLAVAPTRAPRTRTSAAPSSGMISSAGQDPVVVADGEQKARASRLAEG